MAKRSDIHFQSGVSLFDFQLQYGTEEQCLARLFRHKWPKGYRCPKCSHDKYYFIRSRSLYQCRKCRHQASLLTGTIFASTKMPLTIWFLAIYLISQSKEGVSSLKLRRFLGISQTAAMRIKHKIQMVMKFSDDSKRLGGFVQVDDVYWGGKRGRGAEGKTPFIAAIQRNKKGHPMYIRFSRIAGFDSNSMKNWGDKHLEASTVIVSDGLPCFQNFNNQGHHQFSIKTTGRYGDPDFHVFDWLNTVIVNVKNSIVGTYHGLNHRHLPRYLAEFCYRFNRRFDLQRLLQTLIYHASQTAAIPERQLRLAEDWW
ncbi:IS1595 family transposase [Desulfosediminicola ganghwensis]|uniref:IS1595 family transposase n=1 Tax=Desulfosediminicola ganghwensis TaxID=2569540 RepID=UPI0010AD5BA9|nr:IS1595 family transposase [Desulfosediminicola ganghwensis]